MLLDPGYSVTLSMLSWLGWLRTDAHTLPKLSNTLSVDEFKGRTAAEPFEADFPSFWVVFRLYL